MLPDSVHPPAAMLKKSSDLEIPGLVAGDLGLPISGPRFWHPAVGAASVPETAVHEYRETGAAEDKIGASGDWLVPAPAGDAGGAEHRGELQLGGFVAARADGSHDLAALLLCEHVGHEGSVADLAEDVRPG